MTTRVNKTFKRESLRVPGRQYKAHTFCKNMSIEFLQLMFGNRDEGNYHWDREINKTEILVIDKNTFNLEEVERKPVLVINRGPMGWTNSGGIGNIFSRDSKRGKITYSDLLQCNISVYAISRNGIEAEDLAFDVMYAFRAFKKALMKIGFFKIDSVNMGAETIVIADSRPVASSVPVTITMLIQDKWSIEPEDAARMEKLIFEGINIS